jgi:hypothetical protein
VLLGELKNVVAARSNSHHFGIDSVNPLIGIHVQFSDKPAPDKTDRYFCHEQRSLAVKVIITSARLGESALLNMSATV